MEFKWRNRMVSGSSEYRSGLRRGALRFCDLQRGHYTGPGACFEIGDAAGFFRFRLKSGMNSEFIVGPTPLSEIKPPRHFSTGGESISRIIRKKRSDDLTESRQYYPGDDVRRINWRTYAHTGQLFIRIGEEQPDPKSRLVLMVDLSGSRSLQLSDSILYDYLDCIAGHTAGLAEQLEASGVNIAFAFPGSDPGPLSGVGPDSASIRTGWLSEKLSGLWWDDRLVEISGLPERYSAALIIAPAFSENAGTLCRKAADAGMAVSITIPLPPESVDLQPAGLLRRLVFTAGTAGDVNKTSLGRQLRSREALSASAEALVSGLHGIEGVASAEIV